MTRNSLIVLLPIKCTQDLFNLQFQPASARPATATRQFPPYPTLPTVSVHLDQTSFITESLMFLPTVVELYLWMFSYNGPTPMVT